MQAGAQGKQAAHESAQPSAPEAENGGKGSSWSNTAVPGLPARPLVSPAALDANGEQHTPQPCFALLS